MGIRLPRIIQGHYTDQIGEVTLTVPVPVARIPRGVIFGITEDVDRNDRHFLNLKIGWGQSDKIQVLVYGEQAIGQVQATLERGDVVRLLVQGAHIVRPNAELGTKAFASARLYTINGRPQIEKIGHVELPESQFDTGETTETPAAPLAQAA